MSDILKQFEPGNAFEYGLSAAEMTDIIANKMHYTDLDPWDAFQQLSDANKLALAHLVKVGQILDVVFLKQDHPHNLAVKAALAQAADEGDAEATDALTIFTMHNGIEGLNMYAKKSEPLLLFKNLPEPLGGGLYPSDITKEELIDYVLAYPEQAASILGNNTAVVRAGDRLEAIPYSIHYAGEMQQAARELLAAARATDHAGLAEYLRWQAQALVNDSDPEAMYMADKLWIELEDAPIEFTLGRESYEDLLSAEVAADPRVEAMLKENGIRAKRKDIIGIRVGIINREAYEKITLYRNKLDDFNQHMPLLDEYRAQAADVGTRRMTMADVDLVALSGDFAAARGGIVTADNLPNGDKLAVQLKVGSRLVFHRQIRNSVDTGLHNQFMDALIDPAQHHLYERDAWFLFLMGHELSHSLGPLTTVDGRDKGGALGKSGSMIEENKADLASICMAAYLNENGILTAEQVQKVYVTWIVSQLPSKEPLAKEAHRSREIMQLNYFREKGAITLEAAGKLHVATEKMAETARDMLTEVIHLQLNGNPAEAQAFVDKYAAWNDALQHAVDIKMGLQPKLYRSLRQPIRDMLLAQPS
jgi:hypothetical protein